MKTTPAPTSNRIYALFAIILGALLVPGAMMFLLVTFITQNRVFPLGFTIAPIVQISMGLLTLTSGLLLFAGVRKAKWLFFAAIAVVILNIFYLLVSFILFIQSL